MEMDFTPVKFSTLTFAGLLEDIHLSRAVGTFPAGYFIFDAGVTDFMAVRDEQLPDTFGSESLFSGMVEVRLKIRYWWIFWRTVSVRAREGWMIFRFFGKISSAAPSCTSLIRRKYFFAVFRDMFSSRATFL
jgi:hypothetical protein